MSGTYGSEVSINGKELPYSPDHTVTVGLEYNINSKVNLRGDLRYVSEVYTDFENIEETDNIGVSGPIPSYSILNISGSYQLGTQLKLFFSGKNIADEIYIGSRFSLDTPEASINMFGRDNMLATTFLCSTQILFLVFNS